MLPSKMWTSLSKRRRTATTIKDPNVINSSIGVSKGIEDDYDYNLRSHDQQSNTRLVKLRIVVIRASWSYFPEVSACMYHYTIQAVSAPLHKAMLSLIPTTLGRGVVQRHS